MRNILPILAAILIAILLIGLGLMWVYGVFG